MHYATELPGINENNAHLVQQERRHGSLHLRLTDQGESEVMKQDSGESGTSGGDDHRHVLRLAFEVFTALGYAVTIPDQQGSLDVDGLADPPIDPSTGDSMREVRQLEERLRETFPEVADFSDGAGLTFEAETSTPKKPQQPITNLRKAVNNDQICVYVTKDGTDDKRISNDETAYWCRRLELALYDQRGGSANREPICQPPLENADLRAVDDSTDERLILSKTVEERAGGIIKRHLYNRRNKFAVEERTGEMSPRALRPLPDGHDPDANAPPATWVEEHPPDGDPEIVLRDEKSGEIARFHDPTHIPSRTDRDTTDGQPNRRAGGRPRPISGPRGRYPVMLICPTAVDCLPVLYAMSMCWLGARLSSGSLRATAVFVIQTRSPAESPSPASSCVSGCRRAPRSRRRSRRHTSPSGSRSRTGVLARGQSLARPAARSSRSGSGCSCRFH